MLCMLCGTGFMIKPLPLLVVVVATLVFVGTEIRVRIEDRLLASHFGDPFRDYNAKCPAYIPLLK
jgi:protein-S-isoprenylcysteine O-methyltransferase Ste14